MRRLAIRTLALVVCALGLGGDTQAQYSDATPPYQEQVSPYGYGVYMHDDGGGLTTRAGNEMLVERVDGSAAYFQRNGAWEYRQHNNGVHGYYHYDDARQVQQFDYRNPYNGARVVGENPYPSNSYGRAWSRRGYGW
jgi:hypothetical protein